VPDAYAVNPNGLSGNSVAQRVVAATPNNVPTNCTAPVQPQRYDKHRDDVDVVTLCPTNKSGEKMAATKRALDAIAKELNLSNSSVKAAMKRMIKDGTLEQYTK